MICKATHELRVNRELTVADGQAEEDKVCKDDKDSTFPNDGID
jgi:hypothetical protein